MSPSDILNLNRQNAWTATWPDRRSLAMRTDEQLARDAQENKTGCLQELVERHHAPLFGFLYRLTGGDRPLAEDLTQDAFLRAIQSLHLYRYPRPFKPWLYAIAVNRARDVYRQAIRRPASSLPDAAWENQPDPGVDFHPEASLVRQIALQDIATAILALPYLQREALILRYSQELSLVEIAEIVDVPVGTVKSRLSLGLQRLRRLLEEA